MCQFVSNNVSKQYKANSRKIYYAITGQMFVVVFSLYISYRMF